MRIVFSFFLFFLYKLTILANIKYWLQLLPLRIEMPVVYFYSFVSLFQFFFIVYCVINFNKESKKNSLLSLIDNFSFLIIIMEIFSQIVAGIFLFKGENDFYRLYFIFLTNFLFHQIFYLFYRINSYSFLKGSFVETLKIRTAGRLFFNLLTFLITVCYVFLKVFREKSFFPLDIGLTIAILSLNLVILFVFEVLRTISLKKLATSPFTERYRDFDTLYVQTLFKRFKEAKKDDMNTFFVSDYISNNLREGFLKKGLSIEDREYRVVLISIKVRMDNSQNEIDLMKDFIKTLGFFAREYDAFLVTGVEQFFLIFGFPVDFEHKNYNAIEVAERLIRDTAKMEDAEESRFYIFAGICEGNIRAYLLPLRNSKKNEIYIKGEGIEFAEKISNIARTQNIPLLVSGDFYEKMKNRIFVSKALKIREKNEERVLYQVKL